MTSSFSKSRTEKILFLFREDFLGNDKIWTRDYYLIFLTSFHMISLQDVIKNLTSIRSAKLIGD